MKEWILVSVRGKKMKKEEDVALHIVLHKKTKNDA